MKQKPFQMNQIHRTLSLVAGVTALLFTACKKDDVGSNQDAIDRSSTGLSVQTIAELRTAKTATEKYRSINAALADGYVLDTIFNPATPEILVYNKQHDGTTQLVAVEYAVPIPLTPNKAPEGFTGTSDAWSYSTTFNLWLLHSWVWEYNPQGIFNPSNPLVHLH